MVEAQRRVRPEVYRRRRLVTLMALTVALLMPWFVTRGTDEGIALLKQTPTTTKKPPADPVDPLGECRAAVDALPLRARLALTLMVGIDGDAPPDATAIMESTPRPGGVFVRKGVGVWRAGTLLAQPTDGLPLLVAVDDEGGRVQPLQGVLDDLPSAARLGEQPVDRVQARARARGEMLASMGIDVVFAPVVDVGGGGGIGDRSFGAAPDRVAAAAGAYAAGLRQAGLVPVLKHFPGQGRAAADTHDAPSLTPPIGDLRGNDLRPYTVLLAEEPTGVMVGHLDVPGLTEPGVPASLSPGALGLLRGSYDFQGLVVTDDTTGMEAVASRFDVPEAAERALVAGVDLVLMAHSADIAPVLDRLEDAVGKDRLPAVRLQGALDRIALAGCSG